MKHLKLDYIDYKTAKRSVMRWHYSKAMPAGKLVKIGVWEHDKFIGCVIFGRGANNNMLKPYNLKVTEGCELVRIALDKHETEVTKIVSIAIKMLKKLNPGLKIIISYADAREQHLGKIYQAGNWIYTGYVKSTDYFLYNGRYVHQRTISSAKTNNALSEEQYKQLKRKDGGYRFRYLYPLDKDLRVKILSLKKEYPKDFNFA